jgi:hypothetical protein
MCEDHVPLLEDLSLVVIVGGGHEPPTTGAGEGWREKRDGFNNCRVYFVFNKGFSQFGKYSLFIFVFNKGFSQFGKYWVIRQVSVIFMSNSIRRGG